jgi:hypothetical protein
LPPELPHRVALVQGLAEQLGDLLTGPLVLLKPSLAPRTKSPALCRLVSSGAVLCQSVSSCREQGVSKLMVLSTAGRLDCRACAAHDE